MDRFGEDRPDHRRVELGPEQPAGVQPSRLRYRPELDGMRGVAVALVIVHHAWQPHRFAGFLGVDIFFALSGYLITTILIGELDRTGSLRFGGFYLRRMLRLYPALLTMLLATFPLYLWLGGGAGLQLKRDLVAATYTGNLYMTYRHQWLGPLAHTWSLALEEQYYLVWPIVLFVALRVGLRRQALTVILIAGALVSSAFSIRYFGFRSGASSSFPLQSTCVGLLAGSALAVLLTYSLPALRVLASHAIAVFGVGLLVLALVLFSVTRAVPDGAYVPIAVLSTIALIGHTTARHSQGIPSRALSWRPIVALGRISYGVYLWHYPIVLLVARHCPTWSPLLRLVVVAPAAIALAFTSYRYVETPFLRLKNRIGRGSDAATPAVPDVAALDLALPGGVGTGGAGSRHSE
jgi:peptidoglycan/LPS O-acetylase OafA/YrhL